MRKRLFLIDGHSQLFQAFYAIRNLRSPAGVPVNAVYGFTAMLQKLLREERPDYIAVAFDTGEPTFRHERYEEYKANRDETPEEYEPQVPLVRRLLEAYGIPVFTKDGYEADDIIGTIAKKAANEGLDVFIVTRDKDLLQLLSDGIYIYDSKSGKVLDIEKFRKERGIEPKQMIDVLALAGDSSDNIPGVRLIGEKTALQLIREFGSLENVLSNLDKIPQKKRREYLEADADKARLSKELVTINTDVPLDFDLSECRYRGPDVAELKKLFEELGFRRFLEEFDEEEKPTVDGDYKLVNTEDGFETLMRQLSAAGSFAFDVETTSTTPMEAELVGLSFAWKEKEAYYVPVMAPRGETTLNRDRVLDSLRGILCDESVKKIGQNLKYDSVVLRKYGVELRGITFDTMVASYLIDPGKGRHNLDYLAQEMLNHRNIRISSLIGKGKKQKTMDTVPLDAIKDYACQDADVALRLSGKMAPRLKELGLDELFREVEMPLVEVLAEMEWNGVAIDVPFLESMSARLAERMREIEEEIYEVAGQRFNISSPKQLSEVLFGKLGLHPPRMTKKGTGYSTDAAVLQMLAMRHPLPALVLEYRQLSKLKSTYVDALPKQISPIDGRIHASFNQTVTATGRLSSSDPNLQNIPIKTELGREIRRAFVAGEEGNSILSADYSQIELRILAHCSGDPILKKAFQDDMDIHSFVASQIYGVPQDEVTPEMRHFAKTINFSIIYGKTPYGLSQELGIPTSEARQFIDAYFERYSRVREYIDETLEAARKNGYITTLLGRRRYFRGLNSSNSSVRAAEERAAFNAVIQGSAADMIKVAMNNIHKHLKGNNMRSKMILQVHDELVFEVHPSELEAMKELVEEKMRSALELDVPVKVNIGVGKNWLEAGE